MPSKTRLIPGINRKSGQTAITDEAVARIAISEDGKIVHASPAFCILSNKSMELLKDMPASMIISFSGPPHKPAKITDIQAGFYKIFIEGKSDTVNFRFDWLKTPDNRRYLIGFESKGNIQIPSNLLEDFAAEITEEKARNKEENFSLGPDDLNRLLGLSRQALIIAGDLDEILYANEVFCELSGYSAEELEKIHLPDLFDAADRHLLHSAKNAENNPATTSESFESSIAARNGQTRWMEWRLQAFDGKLYCSGRDISSIRNQQLALERRERQLSEAESIGRMGHWHWTIGEPHMEWSQEIFRIFGVTPENFVPGLQTMNKMVHKSDTSRLNQVFQRALIEENDYDMEFRIIRPDGEIRHIRCEGRCARDTKGEVYALYGIMQDMTERLLYERQLREAKEASERAYAAKTQFLANMSHELRTPLNAIIGFSEMIERQLLGPIGTEKYLEYISGIRESGEHLLDLISDILDMSKIEAGKYELDLGEVQIGKILKLAIHMIEGRARDAAITVSVDQNFNDELRIVADRRAVLQILLNILSNAVKFTGEGGYVKLQSAERGQYVTIKVIDNGIGIPPSKINTITKPFEQVSSSYARNHEGSGLGLAITKELVEMHGGTLNIESVLGSGTTVTIRLPLDARLKAGNR